MSTETPASSAPPAPRRIGPITVPRNLGPTMLLISSALGIAAVFWGQFVSDPGIEVRLLDAGPEAAVLDVLRDDHVYPIPGEDLYVVALDDGRLRAVDGRVQFSGCAVDYLPNDPRGETRNPFRAPGVLEDPCSGAVWSVAGDAIARVDEPLRTPQISFKNDEDGVRHLFVEVISVGDD